MVPAYFFCGHVHDKFGFKKLYNTYVFNAACDESTTRGWVVDLENGKHEKVVLNVNSNLRVSNKYNNCNKS